VVQTNTVELPNYEPSSITPTPYSCENCHWPSGAIPHEASTYDGGGTGKAKFLSDWKSWTGLPKPTVLPDRTKYPQPIEANGPVYSGILNAKPYRPNEGTHHEVAEKVFLECYNCHGTNPEIDESWDPTNPYLIRFCENCHSVGMLHSLTEHIAGNDIYRFCGVENTLVTTNEKCIACHGAYLLELPPLPSDRPFADRLEPNFGPPGVIVNIFSADSTCFNEDPVSGLCSFGDKRTGDKVMMGQKDEEGNWYWVDVPIYSWSEHLIQIMVPSWTLQPGKTRVKVYKESIGTSAFKVFNVRGCPVISTINPSVGNWDQVVDIRGEVFGVKQEKVYEDGYGYSTYVQLYAPNDTYRVAIDPGSWNQNKVSIRLRDLLDIYTGYLMPERALYRGLWNVSVITDYFKDDGDGKYNYGLAGLDTPSNPQGTGTGDELLYRAISDPVCFTVTKEPYINSIEPNIVPFKNTATIYGSNFGITQGTSVVKIWNKKKRVVKIAKIISWSKTAITFKVPYFEGAIYPKETWVQVVVRDYYGKTLSNEQPLTIESPRSKH
jgi:hypothetical protein